MGQHRPNFSSYEDDFYSWAFEQAELLRAGRLADADIANIAEEIETLGRSEASALRSSLRLIAMHMLKLHFQPRRATRSWRVTIERERISADHCLAENPGLKSKLQELFRAAYVDARRLAAVETGLPIGTFSVEPSFSLDQLRGLGVALPPTKPTNDG